MKSIILILLFLITLGCKQETYSTEESVERSSQRQKRLDKIDLPIEVIQADVTFLSQLIRSNNAFQLRYELNVLNNYRIHSNLEC